MAPFHLKLWLMIYQTKEKREIIQSFTSSFFFLQSPLHGFGISISGGNNENKFNDIKRNHFQDENQSLIVCEVIKNGPAVGKLLYV